MLRKFVSSTCSSSSSISSKAFTTGSSSSLSSFLRSKRAATSRHIPRPPPSAFSIAGRSSSSSSNNNNKSSKSNDCARSISPPPQLPKRNNTLQHQQYRPVVLFFSTCKTTSCFDRRHRHHQVRTTMAAPTTATPVITGTVTSGAHVSNWLKEFQRPRFQKLTNDTQADVCVVGGGISGLTTAYLLTLEGKSVVLLEDGEICSGETGRTTAHIMSASDERYFKVKYLHGAEGARRFCHSMLTAIDIIEENVKRENIQCDFFRLPGYLFLAPEDIRAGKADMLEHEIQVCHEIGFSGVKWADRAPFPGVDTGRCLMFPGNAQFHPVKYCCGLAEAIVRRGGRIYTNTHAAQLKATSDTSAEVLTSDGHTVRSTYLVAATNVPVHDRYTMHTKLEPNRSYVTVGQVPKGSVEFALFWDTLDPYHYVRLERNSDNATAEWDYLIIGGEDHKVGHPTNYEERYQRLEKWALERFPMITAFTNRWSGQVIETVDYLPYIGHNPLDYKNSFIITGDSGQGMTNCTSGAKLVTDLIMGRHNDWAEIFKPSRINLRAEALEEFAMHNVDVFFRYKEWLTSSDVSDIEDVKPGCGAIMRQGITKLAIYRDEDGTVHARSAVCPHLKCIVQWNSDEKSFDCPCHGSRFDRYGTVINGPSRDDLQKVNLIKEESSKTTTS